MIYKSTKTYGHDIGLSCAFRQWGVESHCRFIHGYALKIHLEFSAHILDGNNWVIDFGSLKPLKQMIVDTFDHKLVIAEDDPAVNLMKNFVEEYGLAEVVLLPSVGCEKFAEYVARLAQDWLAGGEHYTRVWLSKVEVAEHGANSAILEFEEGEVL